MKDIPTLLKLGLVDYPVVFWNALFAPANTPQPTSTASPGYWRRWQKIPPFRRPADFGSVAVANSPADFARMLREETAQWDKALDAIGLKDMKKK